MSNEFGVFKIKFLKGDPSFKTALGFDHVGTSDKPKDKKPDNAKSRKPVRK